MNKNKITRALLGAGALTLMSLSPAQAQDADGTSIIRERCTVCHIDSGDADKPFSRISEQRKTPEGWMMTISRMQKLRGAVIPANEKRALVKYLADNQGLAPTETDGLRYVLEKEPNVLESFDPLIQETCVRCHSGARIALQRRTEDEWKWLVHFHMGQQPTAELHAGARDRDWFGIALNQVAPKLGQDYALDTKAWSQWQAAVKQPLNGTWAMSGFLPQRGNFNADVVVTKTDNDHYELTLNGQYEDGSKLSGSGKAVVYTGYEWRASVTLDGVKMRQVLAASADGKTLAGRMFERDADVMGGPVTAVKANAITKISPSYIRQGERKLITVSGSQLKGTVALGSGVKVIRVQSRDNNHLTVLAEASHSAAVGSRNVQVGKTSSKGALTVYDQLARVEITPVDSIARVGGAGGLIPKQKSWYRAVGYAAGQDGKPGTADDLRLGYMPASWSLKPFNEIAVHDEDIKYAGTIDSRGIFTPGDAGPNPARKMSTNNVGNLAVVGTVEDGQQTVSAETHLLVTVQKFVQALID